MTEDFLMRSFELMGEKPEAIKVMRNKHTGLPAGFGFCQFRDEKQAMEVLHKLNGKIIPYSQPVFLNIIWQLELKSHNTDLHTFLILSLAVSSWIIAQTQKAPQLIMLCGWEIWVLMLMTMDSTSVSQQNTILFN